jgi:hypothetical protein
VILKKETYDDSINRIFQEGPYEVVSKTPLHRMVRHVKDTLANIKNKHGVDLKYVQHSNPKTPRIYELPKIHKPGNRPCLINSNNEQRRTNRTLVQVADQQDKRPFLPTRTVRQEDTRIR